MADPDVDAVYVASPHSEHHEHALLALRAGKPVLVEKAFTRSLAEAEEVLDAAASGGLLAAEAMWSRYLPTYDVVRRTVAAGTLGDVVLVEADHGQRLWPGGPARLSQPDLAGGALLDLGVYPVSFADHVLGGLDDVAARGILTDLGVDATTTIDARGPGGGLARVWCTMAAATACPARVVGRRPGSSSSGRFYDVDSTVRLVGPDESVLDEFVPEVRDARLPLRGGRGRPGPRRGPARDVVDAVGRHASGHGRDGRGPPPGGRRLPRRVTGCRTRSGSRRHPSRCPAEPAAGLSR